MHYKMSLNVLMVFCEHIQAYAINAVDKNIAKLGYLNL